MKFFAILVSLIITAFLVKACNKNDEVRMNTSAPHESESLVQKAKMDIAASQERRDKRIKSGDTLAMNYQNLRNFLPVSIKEYKMEDVDGQSSKTVNNISIATRRYINYNSDEEEPSYIEIQLIDYNQASQVFSGLTVWSTGVNVETDERYERTFSPGISNIIAFESYDKTNNKAEVTYGIAWRFILHIEANNQINTDFVKKIAGSMRLGELSSL